jgi:hypothetical protein
LHWHSKSIPYSSLGLPTLHTVCLSLSSDNCLETLGSEPRLFLLQGQFLLCIFPLWWSRYSIWLLFWFLSMFMSFLFVFIK